MAKKPDSPKAPETPQPAETPGPPETVETGTAKGESSARSATTPKVTWDDSKMRTLFANVVNGSSTREEVTLFFGQNLTWDLTDLKEVKVELSERIVMTPYAAKRLWVLLGGILQSYERRFGKLDIDTPAR